MNEKKKLPLGLRKMRYTCFWARLSTINRVLGGSWCKRADDAQGIGARLRRENLRKTWVPKGEAARKMESERGIYIRFVVGYRQHDLESQFMRLV